MKMSETIKDAEEFLKIIKNRRTITPRDYNGDKISEEEMNLILESGNWGPTHGTTQPWRYVIFTSPDSIQSYFDFLENWYNDHCDSISEEESDKFRKKFEGVSKDWPYKVSHLMVICMKRFAKPDKKMPEWEEICAVAMSVQNMHLMASKLGIGGFWSSHTWAKACRESTEMKSYLNLEEEDRIFGAFVLGKVDPLKAEKIKSSRSPMDQKIQWR